MQVFSFYGNQMKDVCVCVNVHAHMHALPNFSFLLWASREESATALSRPGAKISRHLGYGSPASTINIPKVIGL